MASANSSLEIYIDGEVNSRLVCDGKNRHTLQCLRCDSKILKPDSGTLMQIEFDLPTMKKKTADDSGSETPVKHVWLVTDMFIFENISFSHTKDNVKYLACADCEVGPIGWSDISTKNCHIALDRVKYE